MTSPKKSDKAFLDWVQEHEREWGTETYPQRPQLKEILSSPVVVFWEDQQAKRYVITLHPDLKSVEQHLARLLFRSGVETPKRRVALVFSGQKRMGIKGVQVQFEAME